MVSIPPLKSSKRDKVLMYLPIGCIMAETDSPIVGKTPRDVEISVRMIAEAKKIDYEKACEALARNTKTFFNIENKLDKQKHGFIRH
jgi:Tat protein secretion system quality control protein TatD with DNase activity